MGLRHAFDNIVNEVKYEYDANGNRKNFETGKNNQLTSDGEFCYSYDDEGNRIEKRSKDSSTRYEWDHRNRLVKVVDNGKSVEYDYDYQNRLVRRNDELFVHDGWQIVCSLKNGKIEHRYLWGAVQDELLAMDDIWTLRDHLNTVRKVVDMRGKVVSHLEYNAFGKLVSSTGDKPLFRYTGKMFDDATGLQWNVNRWYDAKVGRWISEDPIGFKGKDKNLYRYAKSSSINMDDPLGLLTQAEKDCCCKKARTSSASNNRALGLAMCCKGVAIPCNYTEDTDFESSFPGTYFPSSARVVVRECIDAHEDAHVKNLDCAGKGTTCSFQRTKQEHYCDEAKAYLEASKCFQGHLSSSCGQDDLCKDAVSIIATQHAALAAAFEICCQDPSHQICALIDALTQ